jgi:hypothetical protein
MVRDMAPAVSPAKVVWDQRLWRCESHDCEMGSWWKTPAGPAT